MPYSTNKKPGGLDAASSLASTDVFVLEKSGTVLRSTLGALETQILSPASKPSTTPQNGDEVLINRGGTLFKLTTQNMIPAGAIANAQISNTAGITDGKLATISTAGKVSNSATTATNANTASAIVARDANGNFTAGTITATLNGSCTGNAGTATKLASDKTFALTGDVTGSVASDLTTGPSIATTIASGAVESAMIGTGQVKTANLETSTSSTTGVTTVKLADGAVTNAKVSSNTADRISGEKISPAFGAQNISGDQLVLNSATAASAGDVVSTSSSTSKPEINLTNTFNGATAPVISFEKYRASVGGSGNTATNNDVSGRIVMSASDGTAARQHAAIEAAVDGAVATNSVSGRLVFSTRQTTGSLTERMRIAASGNVAIGTTDTSLFRFLVAGVSPNATQGVALSVVGDDSVALFGTHGSNSGAGSIAYDQTGDTFDIRTGTRDSQTTRLRVTDSGKILIGSSEPVQPTGVNADLLFPAAVGNKISLWSNSGGSYGLGITDTNGGALFFHTYSSSQHFIFAHGNANSFTELARISGNGDFIIQDKIVHQGDTDTAIRFPANDVIAFETGGTEKGRFSTTFSTSVGASIGGTLSVAGNTTITGTATVTGDLSVDGSIVVPERISHKNNLPTYISFPSDNNFRITLNDAQAANFAPGTTYFGNRLFIGATANEQSWLPGSHSLQFCVGLNSNHTDGIWMYGNVGPSVPGSGNDGQPGTAQSVLELGGMGGATYAANTTAIGQIMFSRGSGNFYFGAGVRANVIPSLVIGPSYGSGVGTGTSHGIGMGFINGSPTFKVNTNGTVSVRSFSGSLNGIPNPEVGQLVFSTDVKRFYFYDGSRWKVIDSF